MLHARVPAQERDLLFLESDRRRPDPDAPGAGVWGAAAIGYGKGVLGALRGVAAGVMGKGLSGACLRASWATVSRMAASFSMFDG